jgi:hypothetical protein
MNVLRRFLISHTPLYAIKWPIIGRLNARKAVEALGRIPKVKRGQVEMRWSGGEVE